MKNMKNKALLFLATCCIAYSCENKELGMPKSDADMRIEFDWQYVDPNLIPTSEGMRVNIFCADYQTKDYGVDDIACTGTTVRLVKNAPYMTLAYSYQGNNIYFRNEADRDLIEAYCNAQTRTTYTRTFPDEATYSQPQGVFYTGRSDQCVCGVDEVITIAPTSKLYKYTFEVRNIEGVEFISETRGAISGMSNSFFIGQNQINPTPATILFNAVADVTTSRITGSFSTFGRLDAANNFTIEILYPSHTGGIAQHTWNVANQIEQPGQYHIIIDNSGIVVPDEGGEAASGWTVDVADWNNETVVLN